MVVEKNTVHNEAEAKIDFGNQRVTDLPTCRRIIVPDPVDEKSEVIFANINARISAVTLEFLENNCYKNGYPLEQNLSREQRNALKTLRAKTKDDIVIVPTDKTGKLVIETKDSYIESKSLITQMMIL